MLKGTKHTKETRKRMSLSQSGERHHFYGKKHSPEAIAKIKVARAKQVWSKESNKKRSETLKGRIFSEESKKKMSVKAFKKFAKPENHPRFGKPVSQSQRDLTSKKLKGRTLLDLHTPEEAKIIVSQIKKARAKQIFPLEDTSIEIKLQNFLKELGIEYFTHMHMDIEHAYRCDIFIPSLNLVLEADGTYWHKYPTRTDLDNIRTKEMMDKGFEVLRLWENDINQMSVDKFNEMIHPDGI